MPQPLPLGKYRRLFYQLNEDKAIPDTNFCGFASMDSCTPALCDALHLGRVVAVSACQAVALLERPHAAAADRDLPLEMGTLVKMRTRSSIAYGMVTGLRVPLPSLEATHNDLRLVELELVGDIQMPALSPTFSAGSPPIRRWTSRSISPRHRMSPRFMLVPRWLQPRSAQFTRMARYRPISWSMSCSASISVSSAPRDRENPVGLQPSSGQLLIKARTLMSYCWIPIMNTPEPLAIAL